MVFHGLSTWTPTSPPSSEFDRHQVGEPVGAMTHSTPQPNLSFHPFRQTHRACHNSTADHEIQVSTCENTKVLPAGRTAHTAAVTRPSILILSSTAHANI